jgi:hypothetical protein
MSGTGIKDDSRIQLSFVAEMVIDRSNIDSGALSNCADSRTFESLLGENLAGCVYNALAGSLFAEIGGRNF